MAWTPSRPASKGIGPSDVKFRSRNVGQGVTPDHEYPVPRKPKRTVEDWIWTVVWIAAAGALAYLVVSVKLPL